MGPGGLRLEVNGLFFTPGLIYPNWVEIFRFVEA